MCVSKQYSLPLDVTVESQIVDVDHRNLISLTGSPGGGGATAAGQLQQQLLTAIHANPQIAHSTMPLQKPGLLPTPPIMPGLWQQQQQSQGVSNNNHLAGGVDSDFRNNYMQQQGIPPPPMPPVMGNYYGNQGPAAPGNVSEGRRVCQVIRCRIIHCFVFKEPLR